jgi:biotin carboxyl carrier protein
MAYSVKIDNREFKVDVKAADAGYSCTVDGKELAVRILEKGQHGELLFMVQNRPFSVSSGQDGDTILVNGMEYSSEVIDERVKKLLMAGPDALHKKELVIAAPMPGLVIDIEVQEGNPVKQSQGLLIVEAMKMQNEIKAPREGIVKKIFVRKGQTVNSKDKLVIIE